ncbi:MAG: hypothetical protein JXA54_12475 [Candidatus Heimdallarchaeota archaeon]|nr:hypothetical protein [Candidatus Heimdallarchaeota archaeon]
MNNILKPSLSVIRSRRISFSVFLILSFLSFTYLNSFANDSLSRNVKSTGFDVENPPIAEITITFDIIFVGYKEDYIDLQMFNDELETTLTYIGIDYVWNEQTQSYDSLLDLKINMDFNFCFLNTSYETALNSFIDMNSWNGTTSALNTTQLNLQEETGERMSIFYELDGRAIDGEAVEEYLNTNKGYNPPKPSYAIYFLNQSRFDTTDHSFEHWFEIDEIDPDSNETVDWFRLEWDNSLNLDVEYPYPCWGFQNRLFFIDPYSHQWYTKWTDIWWNYDFNEGKFDYRTVDLDTYLEGLTPGTIEFINKLNTYLIDYLNDVVSDVGARGDGLLYNQREISAQILLINDEATHGYSQEDLAWIYHGDIARESFEYVVPNEVANITLKDTWIELAENPILQQIVNDYTLTSTELGSYPWYRSDWTYLDGVGIFYAFQSIADSFFDLEKGDTIFTSWVLLLQNISMVAWSYGQYYEYTGLGGDGNVVCFKDLNRYYASDGITPRSGLTTLLIHEIGHVLGFLHAEIRNDAIEGTGGFIRDVMSYYSEGTPYFSIFLKDSLYRTSSFVVYYRNKPAIDTYRYNEYHNATMLETIDLIISTAENELEAMNYLEAFLAIRELYELTSNLEFITTNEMGLIHFISIIIFIPIVYSITRLLKQKYDI